ncbi:MAG: ABC transporter ATP-binding protein [Candidatus Eisenbacteria bacterium]|jgi:ABC-2 type transport system ATP-binding protein|nr:ABC transporter ATP-binding protein [Candidatus Eisenbacteria bacterium]
MVTFEDVKKTYPGGLERRAVRALNGITFTVEPGEVVAYVGPNGAGKTTSINILLGLLRPSSGRVTVGGHLPTEASTRARIGYLPERPYFYEQLSAVEFLRLCGKLSGLEARRIAQRTDELLDRLALSEARHRRLRHFSRGMLQRIGLAQALLHDPDLLVLDEPMSGLDPIGRQLVREMLGEAKTRGKTVLYSSHILADAELVADRAAVLVGGELKALASLGELRAVSGDRLELVLGPTPRVTREEIAQRWPEGRAVGNDWALSVDEGSLQLIITQAISRGARIVQVLRPQAPLEETLIRLMRQSTEKGGNA